MWVVDGMNRLSSFFKANLNAKTRHAQDLPIPWPQILNPLPQHLSKRLCVLFCCQYRRGVSGSRRYQISVSYSQPDCSISILKVWPAYISATNIWV